MLIPANSLSALRAGSLSDALIVWPQRLQRAVAHTHTSRSTWPLSSCLFYTANHQRRFSATKPCSSASIESRSHFLGRPAALLQPAVWRLALFVDQSYATDVSQRAIFVAKVRQQAETEHWASVRPTRGDSVEKFRHSWK